MLLRLLLCLLCCARLHVRTTLRLSRTPPAVPQTRQTPPAQPCWRKAHAGWLLLVGSWPLAVRVLRCLPWCHMLGKGCRSWCKGRRCRFVLDSITLRVWPPRCCWIARVWQLRRTGQL